MILKWTKSKTAEAKRESTRGNSNFPFPKPPRKSSRTKMGVLSLKMEVRSLKTEVSVIVLKFLNQNQRVWKIRTKIDTRETRINLYPKTWKKAILLVINLTEFESGGPETAKPFAASVMRYLHHTSPQIIKFMNVGSYPLNFSISVGCQICWETFNFIYQAKLFS